MAEAFVLRESDSVLAAFLIARAIDYRDFFEKEAVFVSELSKEASPSW